MESSEVIFTRSDLQQDNPSGIKRLIVPKSAAGTAARTAEVVDSPALSGTEPGCRRPR